MDIESLKLFLSVVRIGNITKAAEELFITQSTLSKRIASLEHELGVKLFVRSKGKSHVEITQSGAALTDIAQRMIILNRQALQLKHEKIKCFLTIASMHSAQDSILPGLLRDFNDIYPDVCISVEDHHTAEIFALLRQHKIDIGIVHTASPFPELESVLLTREPYCVVVLADSNIFPNGTSLKPEDLNAANEVFQSFDSEFGRWHDKYWEPYSARIRVNTGPTAELYFRDAADWMIVPLSVGKAMRKKGFSVCSLDADAPIHQIYITYHKNDVRELISKFIARAQFYCGKV